MDGVTLTAGDARVVFDALDAFVNNDGDLDAVTTIVLGLNEALVVMGRALGIEQPPPWYYERDEDDPS